MGKTSASKQFHERLLKGSYSLKEVRKSPFSTDRIAHQQCEKIDRFIGTEASAYQTDLLRKGIKQILCREVMGNDDHFGEPG